KFFPFGGGKSNDRQFSRVDSGMGVWPIRGVIQPDKRQARPQYGRHHHGLAPSHVDHQIGNQRRGHGGSKQASGLNTAGSKGTFPVREPFGNGFGASRES